MLNDEIWADVDSISGRTDVSPSHPLFGDQQHQKWDYLWNRCIDAYSTEPEIREMYFRRLRTLMDELLVARQYETRIDELTPLIDPAPTGDECDAGPRRSGASTGRARPWPTAVDILKNDYLALRRPHLFSTHRVSGEIPEAAAPAPPVVINEIMYNPPGGSTHEFVELYNPSVERGGGPVGLAAGRRRADHSRRAR